VPTVQYQTLTISGFGVPGLGGVMADAYFDGDQRKSQRGLLPDALVQGSINGPTRMNPRGPNLVLTKLRTNENWQWDATNYITLCMAHRRYPSSPQSLPQFSRDRIGEYKSRALTSESYTSERRSGPRFPRIA